VNPYSALAARYGITVRLWSGAGSVVEWVSDDLPGWLNVEVTDADGQVLTIVDKVSVLVEEPLDATTVSPRTCGPRAKDDLLLTTGCESHSATVLRPSAERDFELTQDRVR
jgi:hypothetical protein